MKLAACRYFVAGCIIHVRRCRHDNSSKYKHQIGVFGMQSVAHSHAGMKCNKYCIIFYFTVISTHAICMHYAGPYLSTLHREKLNCVNVCV